MDGKTRISPRRGLVAACATALALAAPVSLGYGGGELLADNDDSEIEAEAEGSYAIAGTTAAIELDAEQEDGEPAEGSFRHTLVFQGLLVDFVGEVTCMAVDASHGRAWIGGVVTENNSDHPSFTGEINQPGRDIWFRVLDTGADSDEPDRTTFVGFEGGAGIPTSAEYCAQRPWPGPPDDEPNARTNPMTDGEIEVEPNDLGEDDD